jgi:1,4-dihydroxy-2-naphthoyl-CoA hydrolase
LPPKGADDKFRALSFSGDPEVGILDADFRVRSATAGAFEMNDAANKQPPFAEFLGIKITHVSPERVTAELPMREELNNRFGIMHGGAIMALADNLGGTATTANLKDGQSTTTIESKTNFFAAVPIGDVAKAECTPLHRGRTTMVWQTRITRGDGKLCALVTQTQLVLTRDK